MHRFAYLVPIIAISVLAGCNRQPPPEVWPPPTAQACLDGRPSADSPDAGIGNDVPGRIAVQGGNHRQTSRILHLYACFLRSNDLDARITISGGRPIVQISPSAQDIPGKAGQAVMVPVTTKLEGDGDTYVSMRVTYLPGGGKTYGVWTYWLKVSAHGQDVRIVE